MIKAGIRSARLHRRARHKRTRRAAAIVEFAVVTPLLLAMVFGIMEFGWAFMVRQTLTHATREACRVAILQGSTSTDAVNRFNAAAAPAGVDVTPTVTYLDTTVPPDGVNDVVVVSASVPYEEVTITGLMNFLHISATSLNATSSMRIEGAM